MSDESANTPVYYNSLYKHGVDGKRRVQIPAKWRPTQPDVEFTLIVWPKSAHGTCLRVLPPEQMSKLMADINAMSNDDPNKAVLKQFIGRESAQVALDEAGRICLPEEMAKAAGIKKAAVLVGLLDRFEIWNPGRYAAVRDDEEEDDDEDGLGVLDPALIGPKPPKPVIKEKKELPRPENSKE